MRKLKYLIYPIPLFIFAILACIAPLPSSKEPMDALAENSTKSKAPQETEAIVPTTEELISIPTDTPTLLGNSETVDGQPGPLGDPQVTNFQVVYTHEGNLWLWKSDGTKTQLTFSYEAFAPKISPDGMLIAYLKGWDIYNAELWAMNIDGSGNRVLVSWDDLTVMPRDEEAVGTMIGTFEWVPGQYTLAYNTIQLFEIPSSPQNNDLRLIDVQTGKQKVLFGPGQGGQFTYSPDGSQIALTTPESLSITNADGSNRRDVLYFPVIFTNRGWLYYPKPVWASDSSYLRVAIPPQDPLNNPHAFTLIWHIPADGSIPHMVGEFVSIPAYNSAPLISPDTQKVIFLAAVGEAFDQLELRILDLTDGNQIALYVENISLHNWNPDSVHFVFSQDFGADFYIGQINSPPDNIADIPVSKTLEWVTTDQFIFTSGDYEDRELRIGELGESSKLIARPFGESFTFDFYPRP